MFIYSTLFSLSITIIIVLECIVIYIYIVGVYHLCPCVRLIDNYVQCQVGGGQGAQGVRGAGAGCGCGVRGAER